MFTTVGFNLLLVFTAVNSIMIPFINNATLISISNTSTVIIANKTCKECLCLSFPYAALNCLSNNTCQFFNTFPLVYKIQLTLQAHLYFLQGVFPNKSQPCFSDTTCLLNRFNASNKIYATVSYSRSMFIDNHGYLVTVSQGMSTLVRLYSGNLSVVSNPSCQPFNDMPYGIAYYNETYYVAFTNYILAIDSNNLTILQNITASYLKGARYMIFSSNGELMIATSMSNSYLLFFNQTGNRSSNYSFIKSQLVNYSNPYGLWYVNDSYFYVTSLTGNAIYAYSAINNSLVWQERLLFYVYASPSTNSAINLTIDQYNRYWVSSGSNGVQIYNNQGILMGTIKNICPFAFDVLITSDYVLYVSCFNSNQIWRIDLNN
ncbi:unnamed protein product [Rotaria socialis]|uniref:Transmembrane protein n=1 Tax=Rotaria socialis TaxID=392032 RepID=A0A820WJW0_9BILA|nr:unnamed protein product [Rotaria socialis]CAF4517857.1 unnamed protein product [Rotaria socialis]